MQKGQALVFILVGVLILAAIAGGAYYLGRQTTPKPQTSNPVVTSSTPQPSPSQYKTTNLTSGFNWEEHFTIKYPPGFLVNDKAAHNTIRIEKAYFSQAYAPGSPSFMYISLIPDDFNGKAGEIYIYSPEETKKLLNMQIGEIDQYQRYKRLADVTVDGFTAKVFEGLAPAQHLKGDIVRELYLHKGDNTYMIGVFITAEDKSMTLETFNQILQSFTFLK